MGQTKAMLEECYWSHLNQLPSSTWASTLMAPPAPGWATVRAPTRPGTIVGFLLLHHLLRVQAQERDGPHIECLPLTSAEAGVSRRALSDTQKKTRLRRSLIRANGLVRVDQATRSSETGPGSSDFCRSHGAPMRDRSWKTRSKQDSAWPRGRRNGFLELVEALNEGDQHPRQEEPLFCRAECQATCWEPPAGSWNTG